MSENHSVFEHFWLLSAPNSFVRNVCHWFQNVGRLRLWCTTPIRWNTTSGSSSDLQEEPHKIWQRRKSSQHLSLWKMWNGSQAGLLNQHQSNSNRNNSKLQQMVSEFARAIDGTIALNASTIATFRCTIDTVPTENLPSVCCQMLNHPPPKQQKRKSWLWKPRHKRKKRWTPGQKSGMG